jgi:hypothetical protein
MLTGDAQEPYYIVSNVYAKNWEIPYKDLVSELAKFLAAYKNQREIILAGTTAYDVSALPEYLKWKQLDEGLSAAVSLAQHVRGLEGLTKQ